MNVLLNKTLLSGKELKFMDLTFSQLVAGELEILTKCKVSKSELEIRLHISRKWHI